MITPFLNCLNPALVSYSTLIVDYFLFERLLPALLPLLIDHLQFIIFPRPHRLATTIKKPTFPIKQFYH